MAKPNAMLEQIRRQADEKYRNLFHAKMDMLLQMGQDAAMIAANETLHMGPKYAPDFCRAYINAMNEMAHMAVEDQKDDPEFLWTKSKVDERIKMIVGEENFAPWEDRYGSKSEIRR